ncbi:hypothetical protein ACQY0O_006407 [Thecaphora frezii]
MNNHLDHQAEAEAPCIFESDDKQPNEESRGQSEPAGVASTRSEVSVPPTKHHALLCCFCNANQSAPDERIPIIVIFAFICIMLTRTTTPAGRSLRFVSPAASCGTAQRRYASTHV